MNMKPAPQSSTVDVPGNIRYSEILKTEDIQRLQDLFYEATGVASLITHPDGRPFTETGKSTEAWDLGTSITVAGKQVANWLIPRGHNGKSVNEADHFSRVSKSLYVLAHELFEKAHHNMLLRLQVHELENAAAILQEKEARFRNLLHDVESVSVQGYAPDGTTRYWNRASERLYGYTAEDAIDRNLVDLIIPPDMRDFAMEAIGQMATTGIPIPSSELFLMRKDGSLVPVFSSHTIIQVPGQEQELFCLDIDLTEQKKIEVELLIAKEKAEQSDRLKSAFLANMSHEIRTPMNGILGFAELLREPDLTVEEHAKYVSIIERSGLRMLNIINDIISISKVESGQMEINLEDTHVNEQIEFILNFFRPEAERKGLSLLFEDKLPADEATLRTDKDKLYAVISNLVKNSIKFTQKGTIGIGYRKVNGCIEFSIRDTGIGIPESQQQLIFERFRQGSETLAMSFEGAGLGLSISKAYVEMLGGRIRVESREGQGSVFRFTIPY
jgi:PAS domain S-box-containing protein